MCEVCSQLAAKRLKTMRGICSKLAAKTLEQCVKFVQSHQ